jgi:hypothetical protein
MARLAEQMERFEDMAFYVGEALKGSSADIT